MILLLPIRPSELRGQRLPRELQKPISCLTAWRSVVVPSLWFLEIANTLLKLERTRRIPAGHRRKALAELAKLSPQVDDAPAVSAFTAVSDVAEKYGLSVYDAAFLELALRRGVPLASRDQPLVEAAKKAGVLVIP